MARYTVCPFYIDESRKTISCEDVCRRFPSLDKKWRWMDMYCDDDWMSCPYAADLNEAYYRQQEGDEEALDKHEIEALKKQVHGLNTKLGRAESKLRKVEQKNIDLEHQKKLFFEKYKKAQEELADYEKHESERYYAMAKLYEDRIAFLIDTYCSGRLEEVKVKAWAENIEYALSFEKNAKEPIWVVYTREAEEDTDEKK